MIRVEVEGRPAPKGSRIAGISKAGNTFTRPASKYEKPWVEEVKRATQVVMRHHAQPERPYRVDVEVIVAPAIKPAFDYPANGDLDKLVRAVVDGLMLGGAIKDDRHITELTARKRYAEKGEPSGAVALISSALVLAGE